MSSRYSPTSQNPVPSPDGALIATLHQSSLRISTYTGESIRSISLPADFVSRCRFIRWSRLHAKVEVACTLQEAPKTSWQCNRILLTDDDSIRVYDINDLCWSVIIEKASSSLGSIAAVAFGPTSNEVLVFTDFGVKLTIWSLLTSRGVEIKDPKYKTQCYSYRPRTGHMAIMTRPAAQDILMLLNPGDHALVKSVEMTTVDAQDVSWSPDGQWLAVRDATSNGPKLFIYTADGHLFKTYSGADIGGDVELGIRCIAWNHMTGLLVLGDYNDNVTVLGKNTFSPVVRFHHPTTISLPNVTIWQEQLDANNNRTYNLAPQPANPPLSASSTKASIAPRGVSSIGFSADGAFISTKDESAPTTVWIWSPQQSTAVAVLIHHSPVKHVTWHPTEPDLLLVHCSIPQPCVHIWKSTWDAPRIVTLPLGRTTGKSDADWLLSPDCSLFNIFLSSPFQYSTALLSSSGEIVPQLTESNEAFPKQMEAGAESLFDEGNSFDLSPIKITRDETIGFEDGNDSMGSGFGMENEMVDDTFHYRRHVRAVG